MNEHKIEDKKLSISDYESLIAKYPLFYLLDKKDIHELATLATEIRVPAQTVLTQEGDIVDSVFLIVSGKAKVTRNVASGDKTTMMDIAVLKEGDSIGLAGTGFFSHRGTRTATVIAMEPMILLRMDIKGLQPFLQKPGLAYPALKNVSDKIFLMNFIQQSKLFSNYSVEQIQFLAKQVNKMQVRADEIIYRYGEPADHFYFIISGKVSLITANDDRKEKVTKLYERFQVIGEEEFIAHAKRKSLARAETETELFVLDHRMLESVAAYQPLPMQPLAKFINKLKALWG